MENSKEITKHKLREKKIHMQGISAIEFESGSSLIVDHENGELKILNKNKVIQLVISVRNDELILNLNAVKLNINASDELNFTGRKINIDATEQINIKTAGNMIQEITKDSLMEVGGTNKMIAQIQKITANLGNVELKANDDVRLDGERVKLNCD